MVMQPLRTFALVCAAVAFAASGAAAQQPYYKGKRLTVLINFAAGGPADIESRIFAKHLVKHIDGAPNLVIQNMDGAGGLIGAQYLGEVAAKDGTALGALTGTAWIYANDPCALARRLPQLRIHRAQSVHHHPFRAHRRAARHRARRRTSSRRRA